MRRSRFVLRMAGLALLVGTPAAVAAVMTLDAVREMDDSPAAAHAGLVRRAARRRSTPDDRLWWGGEVARRWNAAGELPLDVRIEEHDAAFVVLVRAATRGVSPALRRILGRHGGEVVFLEGCITDIEELRHLEGRRVGLRRENDMTYDEAGGLYAPGARTAYVKIDSSLTRARHVLLHELGHMLDDALDDRSEGDAFDRVLTLDDARADLGYPERIDFRDRKQSEYFAESFADYHASARRRLWMRGNRPAAARFWDALVAAENERSYRDVEATVSAALSRRVSRRNAAERGAQRPRRRRVVASVR